MKYAAFLAVAFAASVSAQVPPGTTATGPAKCLLQVSEGDCKGLDEDCAWLSVNGANGCTPGNCKDFAEVMTLGFGGTAAQQQMCDAANQAGLGCSWDASASECAGSVSDDSDGLSTGAIIGIVIGVLVLCAIVGGVVFFMMSKKNAQKNEQPPATLLNA